MAPLRNSNTTKDFARGQVLSASSRDRDEDIDDDDDQDDRPLLARDYSVPTSQRQSLDGAGGQGTFFEQVALGIQKQEMQRFRRETIRWASFVVAVVNCLCAGSITAYSLYAPLFQSRLHYSQYRVNIVSITAELGMYTPVALFGLFCDRVGPAPTSLMAGSFFGFGYLLAAFQYKHNDNAKNNPMADTKPWPFSVMVLAFVFIGMGTSSMYISAVTTCAKNFGRGKHRGLALAIPIAAFGLSGMWLSQVGAGLLFERLPNGEKGNVDVHRFFLFLGCLLLAAGIVGAFMLRIVDEEAMIDEAVDELERSGLLDESALYQRPQTANGYGTMHNRSASGGHNAAQSTTNAAPIDPTSPATRKPLLSPHLDEEAEDERRKKTWLLNAETRRFLTDRTMWLLAAGFFLITGPGEAFINNLGTIILTLYPPVLPADTVPTTAATHVSIVALTSTIARILSGTLSDLLAPVAERHQHHRGPNSLSSSVATLDPNAHPYSPGAYSTDSSDSDAGRGRSLLSRLPRVSRLTWLLSFSLLMSLGQFLLASGALQGHGQHFWLVSASIGAGYGAVFALVPIVLSVVWGVENFATNWGIVAMMPAGGAAVWGGIYAAVYAAGARNSGGGEELCFGASCYAGTFWAMGLSVWVACALWVYAWRGAGGWKRRGIAV